MNDPTSRQPEPAPDVAAMLEEALALHERGELKQAESIYLAILALDPRHFPATHQLGVIQSQRGSHEAAAEMIGKALQLNPRSALAHLNLGTVLRNLHRYDEAVAHYHLSLLINPRNAETHLNLGIALRWLQRLDEALASFDKALAILPDFPKALINRGSVLQALHKPEEALTSYDRALALQPLDVEALTCRGAVLQELHRPAEALDCLDRALALRPADADAHMNRGTALLDLDRPNEALASIELSLTLKPGQPDALMNRGNALVRLRRLNEALAAFAESLAVLPGNTDTLMNRGFALHLLGRHADAIADFDRVLTIQPSQAVARSAKIFMLDYLPHLTFQKHQEERRMFFRAHAADLPSHPHAHPNDRNADRQLVVGYVSADFRRHSAAASFGPVLKHHNKAGFRIICYSGVLVEDDLTREFQGYAQEWVRCSELSDDELAARIRRDGVDILVDLSGHSYGNRLLVFARKPAPVQVTAWGHGGGTGLPMVDYQFTDPIHIPAWARPLFAESLYDLPCCITFEPPPFAPTVLNLPARARGFVTFGSLNRFSKITSAQLELWAAILESVPLARLLLKDGGFDDPLIRADILAKFCKHGISAERIEMRGYTPHREHLATYGEVDIVLDTFPQNGGVTTWEALWMGAPVLAMLGNHSSSRTSGAILGALGLGGWVAEDEAGYLALAAARAADLGSLAQFRFGIRERISSSQAGNPQRYTLEVEAAYRAMWNDWLSR
jgi:predicted O-linked N-acetylglucosamine transferase (SPINDLY family)